MKSIESSVLSSTYMPLPNLGPYLNYNRFDNPKELTKFFAKKLKEITDPSRKYDHADIACSNGEIIYHLKKHLPNFTFYGFDFVPEYIALAKAHPALADTTFEVRDLNSVTGTYDVVSFFGIIAAWWDYSEPINKLLSHCKPGGLVLIDGYFSTDEVEVRLAYEDKSAAPGKWRRDWSVFTRSGLREFLADKASSVEFFDVPMGVELPRVPGAPHINAWTFKDADGRNRLTNGLRMLLDDTLMVIRKL